MQDQTNHIQVFPVPPDNFHPVVSVSACYCERFGKILLLKRATDTPQADTWGVPGGKLEKGESPLDALLREVYEEIGINLKIDKLTFIKTLYIQYKIDYIFYMYYKSFSDFDPEIQLSQEHQGYTWTTPEEAIKMPLIAGGAQALEYYKQYILKMRDPQNDYPDYYKK
jgi:mutator protein MutT